MARKTATIVIEADGRDKGKTFFLTELSAMQAERWATRALLAMARSGLDIPEDIAYAGLAAIAALGVKALGGIPYAEAEPLLAEMFACIQIVPDPSVPQVKRNVIESDIEEVETLAKLRLDVMRLHVDFSKAAARLKLASAAADSPAG